MIVLNDKPGQLCNRIWSYAPFIAFSHDNKVPLFVPFFVDYAAYFPNLNTMPGVRFARKGGGLYMRVMRRISRTLRDLPGPLLRALRMRVDQQNWGLEKWDDATLRSRGSLVFLAAWNHRRPVDDLRPYRPLLRNLFEPHAPARLDADAAIARLRERAEVVVGVHMRRGDYQTFLGGKYYFEWARYAKAMREIAAQTGRKTAFVLCSNETVDPQAFAGLDTIVLPNGDAIEDLYGLSQCDLIVAAPSTFSLWASFVGDVPLRFLTDAEHDIALEEFSPAMNLSMLTNGRRYTLKEEAEEMDGTWISAQ